MIYFGITTVALIIGILLGINIHSYIHRCAHNWERIIDDKNANSHVMVYMCSKCGKTKVIEIRG